MRLSGYTLIPEVISLNKDNALLEEQKNPGTLYLCATPIGNMDDITIRVLKILRTADYSAAEDTRRTRKILSRYHISNRLIPYHQHNQKDQEKYLIGLLKTGNTIALTSDAGTPGISDPGAELVSAALREGIKVESLPGPSALLVALTVSGLNTDKFLFEGFLPRKKINRTQTLKGLIQQERTIILYEAPHRISRLLQEIKAILGDRKIALCRELTKRFEEIQRGKVSQIIDLIEDCPPRGEYTIIIEGRQPIEISQEIADESEERDMKAIADMIRECVTQGMTKRDAVQAVVERTKFKKRQVYAISLKLDD